MLRNLLPFLENITYSKKVNYLFRKHDFLDREYDVSKEVKYLFQNMILSFENIDFKEKVICLLRKYDSFVRKYDIS